MPDSACPPHPGTILKRDFIDTQRFTVSALALRTGYSRKHVSKIVNGHVSVSADCALRLGRVTGTEALYWMRLQSDRDLFLARQRMENDPKFQALRPT